MEARERMGGDIATSRGREREFSVLLVGMCVSAIICFSQWHVQDVGEGDCGSLACQLWCQERFGRLVDFELPVSWHC